MPRKFLRRYLPDASKLRGRRELRFMGKLLDDPFLLHLNRRSVAGGFALGLFVAFIPMPFQMVLAAALAIWLRVNLVISVATVWVSNPITMPPMLFFSYQVGTRLLGRPVREAQFTPSLEWFWAKLGHIWMPLYLGSIVVGIVVAVLGFLLVQVAWRVHIAGLLKQRRRKSATRAAEERTKRE